MACRYLAGQSGERLCTACGPPRSPTRWTLRTLCRAGDQTPCEFFRYARAAGRPLRLEDYLAWRRRGRDEQPPVDR